jgi:hypothetical protein
MNFNKCNPKILHTLRDNKLTGYSDSLTAACVTIASTYLNHIVENFQYRILYFSKALATIVKKQPGESYGTNIEQFYSTFYFKKFGFNR